MLQIPKSTRCKLIVNIYLKKIKYGDLQQQVIRSFFFTSQFLEYKFEGRKSMRNKNNPFIK